MLPELFYQADDGRAEAGRALPLLVWRAETSIVAASSAPLGGGIGTRRWVVNATVPMSYSRFDPDVHLHDVAASVGLSGPGVGMLTGVDVSERLICQDRDAIVVGTVGIGSPTLAAAPEGDQRAGEVVGTINLVGYVPERLSDAALINAVATITEAKVQALWALGVRATGTATDAVCVLCPADGPAQPFGGPRSTWGARLARAGYAAVLAGGSAWLAGGVPWSQRAAGHCADRHSGDRHPDVRAGASGSPALALAPRSAGWDAMHDK